MRSAVSTRLCLLAALGISACSERTTPDKAWTVEAIEIPLYHSSTADPETGNLFHVEYCGAKMLRGTEELHVVYRPIDFPERNPGFAAGDRVSIGGLGQAEDYGAMDGPDYWITDLPITRE